MIDYEVDDEAVCPHCQHSPTYWRRCNMCEDGWIDEYETDPINYAEGEFQTRCRDCFGSGIESWCPGCGANLSDVTLEEETVENPNVTLHP